MAGKAFSLNMELGSQLANMSASAACALKPRQSASQSRRFQRAGLGPKPQNCQSLKNNVLITPAFNRFW